MNICIIGAGHAGIAAAQAFSKDNISVTVFSDEKQLPYYRPRIPAVAFGQTESTAIFMHPESWYEENNIKLKLNSAVVDVSKDCTVTLNSGEKQSFDKIIFAYGATPFMPEFAAKSSNKIIPLWDLENAILINQQLPDIKNLTIIGGGIIGLEAAMRAADTGVKVKVIERAPALLSRNLNTVASKLLNKILEEKGIEIITACSVQELIEENNKVTVKDDANLAFDTDLVIISIGAKTDCTLPQNANIQCSNKISVNSFLQSDNNNLYAAGDIAEVSETESPCSALRASKQGKTAAINIINNNSDAFNEVPVTLQVKYKDFSLFSAGSTEGTENIIELDNVKNICRLVNTDNKNHVIGVQMIGSNKDFKRYEKAFLEGGYFDKL